MTKKNEPILINEKSIKNKIYTIRGQKVMLDSDLAEIYGYTTKAFNQQIKNNIVKFDEDFMFRLAYNEIPLSIRSKILTGSHRNERFLPYAFSESGIYMLMTVLKGPLAIKQSKTLIRTFKKMKDYIYEEKGFLPYQAIKEIEHKTLKHDEDIKEIRTDLDKVMDNFIDPSSYKEY